MNTRSFYFTFYDMRRENYALITNKIPQEKKVTHVLAKKRRNWKEGMKKKFPKSVALYNNLLENNTFES